MMHADEKNNWRLTPILTDRQNLARLTHAGYRAMQCANDGMHRRLIVSMLNRWWPGLAIAPYGVWHDASVLMLINATRQASQTPPPEDDPIWNRSDKFEFDWRQGQRIVKQVFKIYAEVLPDDMKAINRILLREAAEARTQSELQSHVETLTGIPYSA